MIQLLSLYNQIDAKDQRYFESKVEVQSVQKGEFLLMDGQIQDRLFLVREGLHMLYLDRDDKRQVIDFAYRNRFCADLHSFTNQVESSFCIECMQDSQVESISYEDLNHVLDGYPSIQKAYRILLERVYTALLERKLDLGLLTIQERFNQVIASRPELFTLVPHKYIASYLNIDATNFSKLYNACAGKLIFQ